MRIVGRYLDAERAHRIGFLLLRLALAAPPIRALVARRCAPPAACAVEALGLSLRSPLGLAAGFDKNAHGVVALTALGFGYIEIGTVTAQAQPGNPRPRLFRLMRDRAIINRMGFNNDGAEVVAARLAKVRRTRAGAAAVIGVNIGRSKAAASEQAAEDYGVSAQLLAPFADYLTVNISSPNTPGLRDLHAIELLRPLLESVQAACAQARAHAGLARLPLLLKISPDSNDDDLLAIADLALEMGIDGLIATNTTVSREGLRADPALVTAAGAGGLSGPPLRERALAVQRLLVDRVGGQLLIAAAGGIEIPDDAVERLDAGAQLVQAYTGFVYGGPAWPRTINARIAAAR
ncbi:MAG: dihydroorotate dehydrogenase 2 [Jatrophihabitantaceae bacterium]|nr:dihydroorotate dehydrogenase 2 [Jatrophihabitantaceae bacterium]